MYLPKKSLYLFKPNKMNLYIQPSISKISTYICISEAFGQSKLALMPSKAIENFLPK